MKFTVEIELNTTFDEAVVVKEFLLVIYDGLLDAEYDVAWVKEVNSKEKISE